MTNILEKGSDLGLGRKKKTNFKPNQGRHNANSTNNQNQLTQLKAANTKNKRTIASLKSSGSEDPLSSDVEMSDAGNALGGKFKILRTGIQVFRKNI